MKKILCFGDSNTFGFNPYNMSRFDKNTRWSGILEQKLLNKGYKIIEAGGNNRKCFIEEPAELCGYKLLPLYLRENFDFVILALGINDIQKTYMPDSEKIKQGMINLINLVKKYQKEAKIIILSPSILNKNVTVHHYFSNLFDEKSVEKSKEIFNLYLEASKETGVDIINLNEIAAVCDIDGLHYDKTGHQKIAQYLYQYFLNLE